MSTDRPSPSLRAAGEAVHGPDADGGSHRSARDDGQIDLFADFNRLENTAAATEFFVHDQHWSNRMLFEPMGEPTYPARHMTAPGDA